MKNYNEATKQEFSFFWQPKEGFIIFKPKNEEYRRNSWFQNGKFFESKTDENWLIWPYSFQIHWSDLDSFFFIPFFFWMTLEQNLESIYNRNILWIMKQKILGKKLFYSSPVIGYYLPWFHSNSFCFEIWHSLMTSFHFNWMLSSTHTYDEMMLNQFEDFSFYLEFSFSLFSQYILNLELLIIMNIYWPISFINHWIINIKKMNE